MKRIEGVKSYIESSYEEAVDLLKQLGRIPAPSHKEDLRAQFCLNWFRKQGAQNIRIDDAKNVICEIGCDMHDELVVFTAHTDIVFDDLEELPMSQDGDLLYAPGIGDDTANLVNLLMAAKYFLQGGESFSTGILIIANSCEEGLGNLDGTKEIMKTYGNRICFFYSFDGYLSQCTSRPVGSHRFRFSVKGEGGHSYLDFGRENAIHTLSRIITDLYTIEVPAQDKTTYNVGRIEGGTTVNSIPQEAHILYEYRSPSQECLSIMKGEMEAVISKYVGEGRSVEVELLGVRPGMGRVDIGYLDAWTEENIEVIRRFYDGPMDTQPYSTDSNVPLSLGIPANTIGTVVGGRAHTREEWVDLNSLKTGMSIVLSLMLRYVEGIADA